MREPSPESLAETATPDLELATGETIATTPGARAAATGGLGGGEHELTLTPGNRIGRYVVLSRLGAGAMGVVLAAYDPELDRKVALKLLKHRGADEEAARTRLQREAQALAKLGHPNVVAVHDVGVHQGQLFVGMEFVEGETLGEWMGRAARPRPWREVLEVFEAAGRGLAAAHRAGLIHRDFKPDNVMLGKDGRVRVMDFGLARAQGEGVESEVVSLSDSHIERELGEKALDSQLTRTGTLMGTPAYMAREQWERRAADARSDQFAFCVSLYEALYAERPFEGGSMLTLAFAVREGKIKPPPRGHAVPSWLRAVVLRGLAPQPADRWPDMETLLAELRNDPAGRRRRWLTGFAVVGLVGASAGAVGFAMRADARACEGLEASLAGAWDDEQRAAVRGAIEGTGLGYAGETADRVLAQLDRYAEDWLGARVEACEAHHRGEQSGELLDLRMACLDERLAHLESTVEVLAEADAKVVARATQMAGKLPALSRCADVEALRAEIAPPEDPEVAAAVDEQSERLTRALTLQRAGRYEEALALAVSVVEEARDLGYRPLQVRAWQRAGELYADAGQYEASVEALAKAVDVGLELQMPGETSGAASILIFVVGARQRKPEQAHEWARIAGPLSRAAGTGNAVARYENAMGTLADEELRYEDARRHYQEAAKHWETEVMRAGALDNEGIVALAMGEPGQARELHEAALEIEERELGPHHPTVAATLINLSNAVKKEGDAALAEAHLVRALDIQLAALGEEHPNVAIAAYNLGRLQLESDRHDAARESLERAMKIMKAALGDEHPNVGHVHLTLGLLEDELGQAEEAIAHLEAARELWVKAMGEDSPSVVGVTLNLGNVSRRAGKLDESRTWLEKAVSLAEATDKPGGPPLHVVQTSLGQTLVGLGEHGEAVEVLESAMKGARSSELAGPTDVAAAGDWLARALWDASMGKGRDRERAAELAASALEDYGRAGEAAADEHADLSAWIDAHSGAR